MSLFLKKFIKMRRSFFLLFMFMLMIFSEFGYAITINEIEEPISPENIITLVPSTLAKASQNSSAKIIKDKTGGILFANLNLTNEFLEQQVNDSIKHIYLYKVKGNIGLNIELGDRVETLFVVDSEFETELILSINLVKNLTIKQSIFNGAVELYGSESAKDSTFLFLKNQFNCSKNLQLIDFSTLYGESFKMEKNLFNCELSIMDLMVSDGVNITGSTFGDGITFINYEMPSSFDFYFNTVNGPAFFPAIDFEKSVSLSQSKFSNKVVLNGVNFLGDVNFTWASFNGGLDLQFSKFGPNAKLHLAQTRVPNGEFKINIQDFERLIHEYLMEAKSKLTPRDKGIIYESFISQYATQGKKQEVDTASYFYEVFKQQSKPTFSHWFYGIAMGYGYKLWRYVLVVVLPITLLCTILMVIYFKSDIHRLVARINQFNAGETPYPDRITSIMRTLSVTSSILFSIRFKTIWISENKVFNRFVVLNYGLGLGLYVAFLIGTKTSSFDVIKSLAGV